MKCFTPEPRARKGNIDAVITVPLAKLSRNTNLVCQAIETARLEEHINRPNENDGIMVVRIKSIKQFDNMVQDLREIEGTVGKTTCTDGLLFVDHDGICLGLQATVLLAKVFRARGARPATRRLGARVLVHNTHALTATQENC